MATLESATPEVRHLSGFCTQITQSHEAMTNLAIERVGTKHTVTPSQLHEVVADSTK